MIKSSFLTSVLNPPRFAEYCEIGFTENGVYFSMPVCVEPQYRPPFGGHVRCVQFLWWRFVSYLKWRSILHIFKKSLAIRTAGELASVEIEPGAN